jgi:hypothetical protein
MRNFVVMKAAFIVALLVTAVGCAPTGRVMTGDEPTLVGAQTAGADIYNKLIDETLRKLLEQSKGTGQAKKVICFVDVENKGAEELGENKAAIYEQIDTIIVESGVFSNVSRRYVEAALRQTGLRPDEIFLGQGRQQFMMVLGSQGVTPDYLLWGTVTNLSTDGSNLREREYMLTMELVNAHTGLTEAKKTSKMRKEYKK